MDETVDSGGDLKQWLKKQWDCLFVDETYRLLRYKFKRRPKEVEKHISMLKSILKNESDYFWREVCRPNLLAFLYLLPPASKWTEASELIQRCLEKETTSVPALLNHFHILKLQKKDEQADEVLDKLNELDSRADSNVLRLVAMAEVAYCLEYIGPDFYIESIRKYEKVLEEIDNLTEKEKEHEMIQNKLCSWKFQLAQTFARLMIRGKTEQLSGEYGIDSAFRKCSKLLVEVINSKDHFYHGRALVDLVDLYKKNEFYWTVDSVEFPYKEGPRAWIDEAYEISQDEDPYVLERCGRYYRQNASKEDEYLFAIKVLKEAVDISSTRHMAWHQMSLAYKHLCALSVKTDKTSDSKQTAKNNSQHDHSSGGYSNARRLGKARTMGSKNKTGDDSHMHRNTSDYQPKETFSEKTGDYSEKATMCLEKATRLMNDTSCRYLVDLAKCYVFGKRFTEAETCYRLAANTEECFHNDNDAAYLYEQWADKWYIRKEAAGSLEDIKSMYREAIKRSVRGNFTSGKFAFINLRRILRAELKNDSDDSALQLEASMLLSEIQYFEKEANVLGALLDALRNDPVKVDVAWKLINLYHTRNRQYDASAACTYLTVLDRAGQLRLDGECVEDTVIQRKIIINLVTRAADESETGVITKLRETERLRNSEGSQLENLFPQQDLRHAFRWLAGGKTFSEQGFRSNNDDAIDGRYNSTDLCLLAWNDVRRSDRKDRTTVGRLRILLEDWCALGDGFSCFPDDICFDHTFSQAAAAMLSKTKAVAVILEKGLEETDAQSDLSGALVDVLRSLNQLNLRCNICFVVEEGTQLEGFSQFDWPRFEANSNLSNACMISSFFEVLFLNSTKV